MISNLPETHLKKYKNKLKMERLQHKNVKTDKYDCVVNFSPLSSSILLSCTNIFIMQNHISKLLLPTFFVLYWFHKIQPFARLYFTCLNIIYKQIKGNKHDPTTKLFFSSFISQCFSSKFNIFLLLSCEYTLKDVMQFVLYKINEDIFQV